MATVQGGSVARNARSWPRRSFLRKTTAPALSAPMELKDVLGEIEADGANLVHERLLEWALTPPLWHADAVGGVHMGSSRERVAPSFRQCRSRRGADCCSSDHALPIMMVSRGRRAIARAWALETGG